VADWRDRAACLGEPLVRFFEDPLPDDGGTDEQALAYARSFCVRCPVRAACLDTELAEEGRAVEGRRFGVRGAMTPAQRASLYRRGTRACPSCNEAFDPLGLIDGHLVCECGERLAARIPDEGDLWLDRHTALATTVVRWVLANSHPGDRVPSPSALARQLGERKDDVVRVYRAMVEDGVVISGPGRGVYTRNWGRGAMKRWVPAPLRRPA
jgi:hypothetical protein